jgi:uncharacterized protein YbjT (DUF2867 family)
MILVCGATGTAGSEVVRQLSDAGVPCRALVRDPGAAEWIRYPGVEVARGDFARPETLTTPLKGVAKVYLVSPSHPRHTEFESNVIEACQRAGVGYIVKQSILAADPDSPVPFCQSNGEVEQRLAASGIAHTVLRPNFFMQTLTAFGRSIRDQGVIAQPLEQARVSMIDVRDVAAAGVSALTEEGHAGKSYVLTGPKAITISEVARELSAALGRPVTYLAISPEEARQAMLHLGAPDWLVEATLALAASYVRGEGEVVTEEVRRLTGRSPRDFREFARDYATVFLGTMPGAERERRRAA